MWLLLFGEWLGSWMLTLVFGGCCWLDADTQRRDPAAGKTTILYKLKLGEIVTTIPTIGMFLDYALRTSAPWWRRLSAVAWFMGRCCLACSACSRGLLAPDLS